jgi:hypothetical protein
MAIASSRIGYAPVLSVTRLALDLLGEALLVDEAEAAVALEVLDRAVLERRLDGGVARVGRDEIAALLQFQRPLDRADLDLAPDALGALAPLELHRGDAELLHAVLGDAQACVLDVHLHEDVAVAVLLVAAEQLHAALHVRRAADLAAAVALELGVDPAHVLAADDRHAGDGGPDGEVLPVLARDLGGAQGAREDRHLHLDPVGRAEGRLGIDHREQRVVGVALDARG